jgi:hypothetical protein
MKTYVVSQFGVDLKYNEYREPIWEGLAENETDAINRAVKANWRDEEKQEFMKGYLKATPLGLN